MSTSSAPSPDSWTVLVREGRVLRRYRNDPLSSAERQRVEVDLCGGDLDVYTAGSEQAPPQEGQAVDPVALGWTSVSGRACRTERSNQA